MTDSVLTSQLRRIPTAAGWREKLGLGGTFNVLHYGAVGDGVTDDTVAIRAAITAMKARFAEIPPTGYGHGSLLFPPGYSFVVTGSLDLQSITAFGWSIIGYGAVIFAKCTGKTLFDLLGSRRSLIAGLTIRCDPSNAPAIGIQYARQSAAGDSSVHTLRDVTFVGNTSRCFIYNMSAEIFYADNLRMNQGHATALANIVLDGNNHIGPITDFTDTTCPADTANSATQYTFTSMFSGTDNDDPVFEIYGASQIRVINSYGYSTGPMVHYEQTGGTVLRDAYFDMHFELGTHHILVDGSGAIAIIGLGFRDYAPTDSTAMIEAGSGVSLTLTDLEVHKFAYAGSLFAGTITSYQGIIDGAPIGTSALTNGSDTPTGTVVTNLDSVTPGVARWYRVGNMVTQWGLVDYDATATGAIAFRISLLVASNLTAAAELAGTVSDNLDNPGRVIGDATNNEALISMVASTTSSTTASYHFSYPVL